MFLTRVLLMLTVLAAMSFAAPASVPQLTVQQTLALGQAYGQPHGLAYTGGLLWTESLTAGDWTLLGLSRINASVSSQFVTGIDSEDQPNGLAYGAGFYYASLLSGDIIAIDASDHSTRTFAATGAGGTPSGLAWDGEYLWQGTEASVDNLFRLDPATGRVLGSFSVAGGVQGLAWDGRSLWVAAVSDGSAPYVYRYDRSGTLIETFQAPAQLTRLGDMEYDGTNLWALDTQNRNLYKFARPSPQIAPPGMPSGLLGVAYEAYSAIESGDISYEDSQSGGAIADMPVASALRYGVVSSGRCAAGKARGYYDSLGKRHYIIAALAENDSNAAVTGEATFTLTQQTVISSAAAGGYPNGTSINAGGTFTLTGGWQAMRLDTETDIGDTEASFELLMTLTRSGEQPVTIFSGGILLAKPMTGNDWVTCRLTGDMTGVPAVQSALENGFTHTDTLATMSLLGVQIPYTLPVRVGETFSIQVIMSSYAYVDADISAGAEVAMGQALELKPVYLNRVVSPRTPEPATLALLGLGTLALVRRRR